MSRRILSFAAAGLLACAMRSTAVGQAPAVGGGGFAPLEVTLAHSADRTNGVVGGCGCFWMAGGKAEAKASFGQVMSVVAEIAGQHANSIGTTHESLSLVSYLFGPRYTFRSRSRFVPFAQFLVGGVHGFDALFPGSAASVSNPDAFAFTAGGGLNVDLSRRLGIRLIQADYLQTQLPNDAGDRENHLRLSAGMVFRFGTGGSYP
jgi:outer membrane immunogenic protein